MKVLSQKGKKDLMRLAIEYIDKTNFEDCISAVIIPKVIIPKYYKPYLPLNFYYGSKSFELRESKNTLIWWDINTEIQLFINLLS